MARNFFIISVFTVMIITFLVMQFIYYTIYNILLSAGTTSISKRKCLLDHHYGYNITEQALLRVCKTAEKNALSSLIWSHRGHWEGENEILVDGSFAAIELLLRNEIYHFDVDISIAPVSGGGEGRRDGEWKKNQLIVAHPSALLSAPNETSSLSTLTSLLWQLSQSEIVRRKKLVEDQEGSEFSSILLTIEPKFPFSDHNSLSSLVRTVRNSSISQHVAVIVNSPQMLNLLLNTARSLRPIGYEYSSPLNIALAFRSQPKTAHDFKWTHQVSVQQLRRRGEGAGEGDEGKDNCRMAFKSHLPSDSAAVQVNMPDIALLQKRPW